MHNMFTFGNAEEDGHDFSCWFVGQIDTWCVENGLLFNAKKYGLRNRSNLEIKWGVHTKNQERPGGWTKSPGSTAISVLVRGLFRIKFRILKKNTFHEVLLKKEGDYVIWNEELEHIWIAEKESRILTVRWKHQ